MQSFDLAPMSRSIRILTALLIALPVALIWLGRASPEAQGLAWIAALLSILYASVWLFWRPRAFELSDAELVVRFPARSLSIPLSDVGDPELFTTGRELREHIGFALRIGAGGLFGGFGWLWTRKLGLIEFYISRTDALVLLRRRNGRPLLITPERAGDFRAALQRAIGEASPGVGPLPGTTHASEGPPDART